MTQTTSSTTRPICPTFSTTPARTTRWDVLANASLGRLYPGHPVAKTTSLKSVLDAIRQPDDPRDIAPAALEMRGEEDDEGDDPEATDSSTDGPARGSDNRRPLVSTNTTTPPALEPSDAQSPDDSSRSSEGTGTDDTSGSDSSELDALFDKGWETDAETSADFEAGRRSGIPASRLLTDADITAALADGDDPAAMDSTALIYNPSRAVEAGAVLALAQLAFTFGDQASIDAVLADGAASVVLCATPKEAHRARDAFKGGFIRRSPRLGQPRYGVPHRPNLMIAADVAASVRTTDLGTAEDRLNMPGAMVLFTDSLDALAGALARLPVTRLAPLCADVLIYALRQTHSATGQISEDAVRDALPSDAALARMPASLIGLALRERGPLRVARKFAELTTPVAPIPDGPTLNDLPGLGDAGARLAQVVADVAAWRAVDLDWSEVNRGLLLSGPPGTGKTLMAAALARSLGATFMPTTLGDMQKREGGGNRVIQTMASVFDTARSATAGGGLAVLFIDEIDSFASRDRPHDHNTSYFTSVTNTLLTQITDAMSCEGLIVVSATNFPEHLDPALVRAGRLGSRIDVRPPTVAQIPAVLRYHLGDDLAGDDLTAVARAATDLTQADLADLVTTARRRARAEGRSMVVDDLMGDLMRTRLPISSTLRRRVATYAAGRAVACHVTRTARPDAIRLQGTHAVMDLIDWPDSQTPKDTGRKLTALLAGRATEEVVLGGASGRCGGDADSDLAHATQLAIEDILGRGHSSLVWSDTTEDPGTLFARHKGLRERVARRLDTAYARARALVRDHRVTIDLIAADLIVVSMIEGEALSEVLACSRVLEGGSGHEDLDLPRF